MKTHPTSVPVPARGAAIQHWLHRLHAARASDVPALLRAARRALRGVRPVEVALAELALVRAGADAEALREQCDRHLALMKALVGREAKPRYRLPDSHPVVICADEHVIIKRNLRKLRRNYEALKSLGSLEQGRRQINTLKELSHFFLEAEKHHRREEDALFPRLAAHGILDPPRVFAAQHVEFMAQKRKLYRLLVEQTPREPRAFLEQVGPAVEFLTTHLADHIFKEDYVVYPLCLKVFDRGEWREVRRQFDAIGYCCFAPADLQRRKPSGKR